MQECSLKHDNFEKLTVIIILHEESYSTTHDPQSRVQPQRILQNILFIHSNLGGEHPELTEWIK